jgi:hypothetical protein
MIAALVLSALVWQAPSRPAPDYSGLYGHGISFAEFLDGIQAKRAEWRTRYRDAGVSPELLRKVRALPGKHRLLVVAEDWCSDSAQTVPYLARLVDAAPDKLEMRIVNSKVGRAVMDAHVTPDGRGATPTVAVLTADGAFIAAWSERPAQLEAWSIEQRKVLSQRELHDKLAEWYAQDAGKSALGEIVAMVER